MNIKTKAMLETLKTLAYGVAFGVLYSFYIDLVGIKIAAITLLVLFVSWFAYIVYQTNLSRLKIEENFKNLG